MKTLALILSFSSVVYASNLTKEAAELRTKQITKIKYDLFFKIGEADKVFTGKEKISFDLNETEHPVSIDFTDGEVLAVSVNDQAAPFEYNKAAILIKGSAFKLGSNAISIEFAHPYSNNGTGLHRFKDPADGRVYIYSQFEPFDANRLYPCFDQPDLKANFKIKVDAPESWTVISATREIGIDRSSEKGRKIWTFPESARFSTYLISLHAGPYKVWEDKAGAINLRLFARQSLADFIPVKDWMNFTQRGLAYYQSYFRYPYPFKKYDQIVVPEFNEGAMENVAAVTFSEQYIKRGKPTNDDRENLANTLLHEMAHMWFGDLVTMKWWNGLWLNESFATVMAAQCVREATEFSKSWETFYSTDKQWAYKEDQYVTTHPIEAVVRDTDQAFANFDGITYGKGASVLKQLFFYIGPQATQSGLESYFKSYQYSNATLENFIGALEKSSGKNLGQWKKEWLETAGLNSVKPNYECVNNKIQNFKLIQSAIPGNPTLRSHYTVIGFFSKGPGRDLLMNRSERVDYSGAVTKFPVFDNQPCPEVVFTNIQDYDYVKEKLDNRTLASIQGGIENLSDSFLRVKAWTTLWDMVRDAELDLKTYADMIFNNLGEELEFKIVDQVLNTVYGRHGDASLLYYFPKEAPQDKAAYLALTQKLEGFVWASFKKSASGSDLQKRWFDGYVAVAKNPEALSNLTKMLNGKIKIDGFILDQDRRWALIKTLNHGGAKDGSYLIAAEKRKDHTEEGFLSALGAEVAQPSLKTKDSWYAKTLAPGNKVPQSDSDTILKNLLPDDQIDARRHFIDKYLSDLDSVNKNKSIDFQESYVEKLSVSLCNEESHAKFSKFLNTSPQLSPVLLKGLKISLQEDERCIKTRAFGEKALSLK
jgi:aminopeptidase N